MRRVNPQNWSVGFRFTSQYGWKRLCHGYSELSLHPLNWRLRHIRKRSTLQSGDLFHIGPLVLQLYDGAVFAVDEDGRPVAESEVAGV